MTTKGADIYRQLANEPLKGSAAGKFIEGTIATLAEFESRMNRRVSNEPLNGSAAGKFVEGIIATLAEFEDRAAGRRSVARKQSRD